jgi:hypothetical protein
LCSLTRPASGISYLSAINRRKVIKAVVCRPVVGLMSKPDGRSELLTQEVFGHSLTVLSSSRTWVRCRLRDGYVGWFPEASIRRLGEYPATHVVARRYTVLDTAGGAVLLPMGSLLRVTGSRGRRYVVLLPSSEEGLVSPDAVRRVGLSPLGHRAVGRVVSQVIGTPYLWGGRSTFGFDCSGLVQFLFEHLGITLPRDSRDQARCGRMIKHIESLHRLDLVFFGSGPSIDHVAVHLGGKKILHASGWVRVESLAPASPGYRQDLHDRFRLARRIAGV